MQVEGHSLDAQKGKLKKYADYQEMSIVGEYSDEGKSGKSVEGRPQFKQMLSDIENGKHRKLVDGNRCTYKRQWNEERIKAAVGVLIITAGTVLLARFGYDTCMSGIGGWNAIDKRKKSETWELNLRFWICCKIYGLR